MRDCDQTKLICPAIQDASAEIEFFCAQLASARKALERIAEQQLVDERLVEGGDYEYGYDQLIRIARTALKDLS